MQKMDCTTKDKGRKLKSYRNSLTNLNNHEGPLNTFQSTYKTTSSPFVSNLSKSARKITNSLKRTEIEKMMASASSGDVFNTDRYPRAKPFFYQAYIAKSKTDTLSQASSKLGRTRSIGNLMKSYRPEKNSDPKHGTVLPRIKKERFNEDTASEYSLQSKMSKVAKLKLKSKKFSAVGTEKFVPQHLTYAKQAKVDGSHLSQVSDRASEIKNTLIGTIERMNDREVEVMKSAIDSVKGSPHKPRQVNNETKSTGIQEKVNETSLEKVPEEDKDEAENSMMEKEEEEELADNVEDLPEKLSPDKAAGHSTKSKSSRRSVRSSKSTQIINELESQIEDERKEREKLQKEIEEMKKISTQLMEQMKEKKA